jgi:hypothetical protein
MPRISSFYGITVRMYYDEIQHRDRPHFHARYGDAEAVVDIQRLEIIAGELPAGARRLVTEWADYHRAMRSSPLLVEATPLEDYKVHVRFEDGLAADVDLSYLLDYGGVFQPLRDLAYFRGLRSDGEAGTIVWPNGADIAPETLYARAERATATPA